MNALPNNQLQKPAGLVRWLVLAGATVLCLGMDANDFRLKGRIISTSNEPLAMAFGSVLKDRGDFFPTQDTVETGANGRFQFIEANSSDCAGTRNGEAIIRFRKPGYKPVLFQQDLPDARTMNIEVVLAEEDSSEASGWRIVVEED